MLKNRFNPLFAAHDDQPPASGGAGSGTQPKTPPAKEKDGPKNEGADEDDDEPKDPKEDAPKKPDEAPAAAALLSAFARGSLRALGMGGVIARLETSEAALANANSEVLRLAADNTRLTAELADKPKLIAAAAVVRKNDVAKGVLNELGKIGITEAAAPSQISADATPEALLEKFETLKGAEKTAFFRANKTALKAAEAAKNAH